MTETRSTGTQGAGDRAVTPAESLLSPEPVRPAWVGPVTAIAAVVLLGVSLRLVFGSASALLTEIRRAYGLGSGSAALLTAGPVVCLGLFGPLAARAVRRWSVPAVLAACSALVTVGAALRGLASWPMLLLGTLCAGIGIAVANVLGPVLVRLLFPHRIGELTGLLTALVSASAGIASGATIPLDHGLLHSWRATLASWALPSAVAAAVLAIVAVRYHRHAAGAGAARTGPRWSPDVLRSPTAWAITGFMGIQSLLAYSLIAWLPTVYQERGTDAGGAGLVLTVLSVSSIATALAVPVVAVRARAQSGIALAVVACSAAGLIGVLSTGTHLALLWAVLLGLGQGGQLSLALTLMNLRSATAAQATSLSTMAQSIGYLIAATGPVLTGAVRSASGGWTVPIACLLVLMVPLAACGLLAGRGTRVPGAESADMVSPASEPTQV